MRGCRKRSQTMQSIQDKKRILLKEPVLVMKRCEKLERKLMQERRVIWS